MEKFTLKQKHITVAIILLFTIIAFLIVKDFVTGILSAYILAFICLPLYRKLNKKIPEKLSALVCVILALVIIALPLILISGQLFLEASNFLDKVDISNLKIPFNFEKIKGQVLEFIASGTTGLLKSVPSFFVTLLISFFGMFYFLVYWGSFNKRLYKLVSFKNKEKTIKEISKTSKAIVYGLFVIGAIEFLVSFIGFSISGVKFSLLFATMIGFLAFTLIIDPSIIWGPLALVYFFVLDDVSTGIGIVITGLILSIDTILRPKILGTASHINPFLMLIGVLGGLSLFGIFGFILGPMVLIVLLKLIEENVEIGN